MRDLKTRNQKKKLKLGENLKSWKNNQILLPGARSQNSWNAQKQKKNPQTKKHKKPNK